MDNIILNTIKVSTKHLSLRDTLKLRRVCKKLKNKISQAFIIDLIKQKYAKYLKYGDKLCIDTRYITDNTTDNVKYPYFVFFDKMVTDAYWMYKFGIDRMREHTHIILIPNRIYPRHNFSLHNKRIQYYLDIPSNKIVSLNSQIRKHVGISKFQEVVNLWVDVINPFCYVRVFDRAYDLETMECAKYVFWVCMYFVIILLFVYAHYMFMN